MPQGDRLGSFDLLEPESLHSRVVLPWIEAIPGLHFISAALVAVQNHMRDRGRACVT